MYLQEYEENRKGTGYLLYRVDRLYCEKKGIRLQNLFDSKHKDAFYQFADRFSNKEGPDQYVRNAWVIIVEGKIMDMEKQILDYFQEKGIDYIEKERGIINIKYG